MKSLLRSLIALPKKQFVDPQSNIAFDLAYITPEIIVCSGPTNKLTKKLYRYPVGDLVMLLTMNHGDNWHIWNFRGEEKGYDDSDVFGKVKYIPFPDHQAPTFKILLDSVLSIDRYLSQKEKRVAVLHCKAGKGRSGTIACAYLLYESYKSGQKASVQEVIELYTQQRMKAGAGNGVSIKSQVRYLNYWYNYLHGTADKKNAIKEKEANQSARSIQNLVFREPTSYLKNNSTSLLSMGFKVQTYEEREDANGVRMKEVCKLDGSNCRVELANNQINLIFHNKLEVTGDIRIGFRRCYFWFNSYHEPENQFTVRWDDIDGIQGLSFKGTKLCNSIDVAWT